MKRDQIKAGECYEATIDGETRRVIVDSQFHRTVRLCDERQRDLGYFPWDVVQFVRRAAHQQGVAQE